MMTLSALELAAATAVAKQIDLGGGQALIAQLRSARVFKRDFTGVGFYTEFEVDRRLPRVEVRESPGGWVGSEVGPDAYPMEFMVYVDDGFAVMIEGYSYFDGYGDLDLLTADFTEPRDLTVTL